MLTNKEYFVQYTKNKTHHGLMLDWSTLKKKNECEIKEIQVNDLSFFFLYVLVLMISCHSHKHI